MLTYLSKYDWFFSFRLGVGIELSERLFNVFWQVIVRNMISISANELCQISSFLLHQLFCSMKFIPKLPLHFTHIGPSVHFIRFNVLYFLLSFYLLNLTAFKILNQISILRSLYDNLCNFLWCFHFIHLHFVFESLLNNFSN